MLSVQSFCHQLSADNLSTYTCFIEWNYWPVNRWFYDKFFNDISWFETNSIVPTNKYFDLFCGNINLLKNEMKCSFDIKSKLDKFRQWEWCFHNRPIYLHKIEMMRPLNEGSKNHRSTFSHFHNLMVVEHRNMSFLWWFWFDLYIGHLVFVKAHGSRGWIHSPKNEQNIFIK